MAQEFLSDDEVRRPLRDDHVGDDHVGRSPFQLLTVKKVVVGFAVLAAFLCGAAVLAPAKSMPSANLSDGIIIKQDRPYCLRIVTGESSYNDGHLSVHVDGSELVAPRYFGKGEVVANMCYEEPIHDVKVQNTDSDAWTGSLEYSSDGGSSFHPMWCTAGCNPFYDLASKIVVDGNGDSRKQASLQCFNGQTCSLQPSQPPAPKAETPAPKAEAPETPAPKAEAPETPAPKAEAPTPAEAPEAGHIVLHQIKSCELCEIQWCDQGMEVIPRNVASFSGYVIGAHLDSTEYKCAKLPAQPKTVKIAGGIYLVEDQATYEYQGCFEDTLSRNLEIHALRTGATPETCRALCSDNAFFGLQGASHCFCGNRNELGARKSESECNMACHSEPSTMCGGLWRNSIYRVIQATSTIEGSFKMGVAGKTAAEVVNDDDIKNAVETGIAKETGVPKSDVDATLEIARRLEPSSSARFLSATEYVLVRFTIRTQTPVTAVKSQIEQHTEELKTAIRSAVDAKMDVTIESIDDVVVCAENDGEKDKGCQATSIVNRTLTMQVKGKTPAELVNDDGFKNAVKRGIAKRADVDEDDVDVTLEIARRLEPSSSARFLASGDDVFVHYTIRTKTPVAAVTSQIEHTEELKTAISSAVEQAKIGVTIVSVDDGEKEATSIVVGETNATNVTSATDDTNETNATKATDETNATNV